jgi:hypothetical protein
VNVSLAVAAEPGQIRPRFEDFYCVEPMLGLFAIAEGAGATGGLVSRTVVRALRQYIVENGREQPAAWPRAGDAQRSPLSDRLRAGLIVAQGAIAGCESWAPGESGAAICGLLFDGDRVAIARLGDCGAYRLRNARFERVRGQPGRDGTTVPRALPGDQSSLALAIHEMEVARDDRWLLGASGLPPELTEADTAAVIDASRSGLSPGRPPVIELAVPGSRTPRTVLIVGAASS